MLRRRRIVVQSQPLNGRDHARDIPRGRPLDDRQSWRTDERADACGAAVRAGMSFCQHAIDRVAHLVSVNGRRRPSSSGRLGLPSAMTDSEAFNATKFSFCAYQSAGSLASLFRSCDLDALTPLARAASCLRFRGSTPRTFDSKSSLQLRAARTCGVVPDS